MKTKIVLLVLLSIVMGSVALAQDSKRTAKRESILDYKMELGLTDAQEASIKSIHKEYATKIKAARKSESSDNEAMKNLVMERKAAIEGVLNAEQLVKWNAIREQKKAERNNPELKRELKAYKQETIKPVMLEKRIQFETELSAEDKLVIAEVRAKHQAFRGSEKGGNKSEGNPEDRKRRKEELKQYTMETLKPILEKHSASLEKINSDLIPYHEKWKTDMDAIKAKYISDMESKPHKGKKGKHDKKGAIHFLLIDPAKK